MTATWAGPSDLKSGAQYRMNPAEFTIPKQPRVHFCNLCLPAMNVLMILFIINSNKIPVVSLLQVGSWSWMPVIFLALRMLPLGLRVALVPTIFTFDFIRRDQDQLWIFTLLMGRSVGRLHISIFDMLQFLGFCVHLFKNRFHLLWLLLGIHLTFKCKDKMTEVEYEKNNLEHHSASERPVRKVVHPTSQQQQSDHSKMHTPALEH